MPAARLLTCLGVLVAVLAGCAASGPDSGVPDRGVPAVGPPVGNPAVCGIWIATGGTPTDDQLVDAAARNRVVILNAWETAAAARLRELNPSITVLVYKDLASVRTYDEADVHGGLLPTGVGVRTAPESWYATDTAGRRIEWGPYPGHVQMAVWDPGYQQAWVDAVTAETLANGWDGVFADNAMASLSFYSDAVLAGTPDAAASDELLRRGLGELTERAGRALAAQGRSLLPNVSEARLFPGRWTEYATWGGAMEENFAQYADGELLTWQGVQWDEMRAAADAGRFSLLVSAVEGRPESRPGAAERAGFAGAAVLGGERTCWMPSRTGDYSEPGVSGFQSLELGSPAGPATRVGPGVWSREYTGGWVAVNPTSGDADVPVPDGMATLDGNPVGATATVASADGLVLVRR